MPTATPHALQRSFVPAGLDPAALDELLPLFDRLGARELPDADAVAAWMKDYSELAAVVGERGARINIDHACHTEDEAIEKAYLHWIEEVSPATKPRWFALLRHYLDAAGRGAFEAREEKHRLIGRAWEAEASIYRDENIPLQTRASKLSKDYDKLIGRMQVAFDGKEQTLQQLARYQEETDRGIREEAWTLAAARRLEDHEEITRIFGDLIGVRQRIAENADLPDYRAYTWKAMERFDYTPQDCLDFGDAIEKAVVPRVAKLDRERREALGVDTLRPWDLAVDPRGRAPLRPFPDGEEGVKELLEKGRAAFAAVDPVLAEMFAEMEPGRNLDLAARPKKRAGGFQSSLTESREPFIFMNAAGTQRDVDTLLHEGGHAFHYQWASRAEPLTILHHAPMEFCEVASMGMELLACDHYGVFYDGDQERAGRAKRKQLEGIVRFFPWMGTIDGWQHWLYTHPGATPEERRSRWLATLGRFESGEVDFSGHEQTRATRWQPQLHLFHYPFYYVEYGIAQLGALQLWRNAKSDPHGTITRYREALSLGGTRKLPELFEAAGIRFDFSAATLEPLMALVEEELTTLPA
ncbi:M3 family oligoendopeptidase [Phycisphaera mikurensis]|uniref:Putative M3 familiy peptidase n=1 Tax=Phycisphaera mikurensis (strain NBRC 102666 / KCTC 22515 / FYK2301M01) TaxID=1142394 RepID=I0IFJ9_PHYMF|nr:M3 family oligoendopeptidase [Phycisphaera mikurensis]MBB6440571.1 oligoendopeptidase F [Phycisphaera mikurensis]BAM04037.1 putative M3 familiy peptidase [Phycisphaera mikurensis NBRC 102666]